MSIKLVSVALAASVLALLAISPVHAEDKTASEKLSAFHPSEREMTLARGFITLNAKAYPEAYDGQPEGEKLDQEAKNLIYACTQIPIARLPRGILMNCEDLDHFKAVFAQFPSKDAGEEGAKQPLPPQVKETVVPHKDPGATSLCRPPHRMTERDGCQ